MSYHTRQGECVGGPYDGNMLSWDHPSYIVHILPQEFFKHQDVPEPAKVLKPTTGEYVWLPGQSHWTWTGGA